MNLNVLEYNESKRLELIEKIKKIKESQDDYLIFLIDVDDVIYNIEPYKQKVLKGIDYRATNDYRIQIARENSEDSKEESSLSFKILDAILEETAIELYDEKRNRKIMREYERINYGDFYSDQNLFPNAIPFLNYMTNQRDEFNQNIFFVACSHRNPIREGEIKMQKLYEKIPNLDLVITLPFHVEVGSTQMNMKSDYVQRVLKLDDLSHCILIDNSKKNCIDMRMNGGMDIQFLPTGFETRHSVSDHISKMTELDPYKIQLAISYIRYARQFPEYADEMDISLDAASAKVKKIGR